MLLWIVAIPAARTRALMLALGLDGPTITGAIRATLLRILEPTGVSPSDSRIDALVAIMPPLASIGAIMTQTLNLWLAAKITATSGRLHRPWPDLKNTALPPMTLAALSVAVAFCFSGGLLAIVAQIVTAGLMMAYAI